MKNLNAVKCSNYTIPIHAAFSVNQSIIWNDGYMYSVTYYYWILIIKNNNTSYKRVIHTKRTEYHFVLLYQWISVFKYDYRICILHKHIQIRQRSTIGHIFIYVHSVTDLVESRWYVIHISNGYGQCSHCWSFRSDS